MKPLLLKDWLQIKRDRMALFMLLTVPAIVIAILGVSLGDQFAGSTPENTAVAVYDEESQAEALQHFSADEAMQETAERVSIPEMLVEEVLQAQDWITVDVVSELDETLADDYGAVLHIPAGYRLHAWEELFFGHSEEDAAISLYTDNEQGMQAMTIESMIDEFLYEFQLGAAMEDGDIESLYPEGGEQQWSESPISSYDYYAVGMSVFFALSVAVSISSYALKEKRSHVFARILLANASPLTYLCSRLFAGALVTFLQLSILYTFAYVFFSVEWPNVSLFMMITAMFSLAIGALCAVVTSINFKTNSEKATSVLQMFVVLIMGFLGGSFFDINQISLFLGQLGNWTPNGSGLNAYLQALQGAGVSDIADSLLYLGAFSIVLVVIAILLFPRKEALQ